MSDFQSSVVTHRIWQELSELPDFIAEALRVGTDGESPAIGRLGSVIAFIHARLAGTDPALILLPPLDAIADQLAEIKGQLKAFVATNNTAHLTNATRQAEAALTYLCQLPSPVSSEETGALVAAVNAYRKTMNEGLESARASLSELWALSRATKDDLEHLSQSFQSTQEALRIKANELTSTVEAQVKDFAAHIANEHARLTDVIGEFERQFTASQEARSQEHGEELRILNQQAVQIASEQQGQFSSAQESRGREFLEAQAARQTKFDGVVAEYVKGLADHNAQFTLERDMISRRLQEHVKQLETDYENKASAQLAIIEDHRTNVEKLVGVIGNLGVTSGYQTAANHARYSMWFWQFITVAAIIGLIAFGWHTLPMLEDKNGAFHWGVFAGRVFLALAFGVLAAYAGSQADKLFVVEGRNRKLALELEAVGPYLTLLPEEEQSKFRIALGERVFGREDLDAKHIAKSPATLMDVLATKQGIQLVQLIADATKKEQQK